MWPIGELCLKFDCFHWQTVANNGSCDRLNWEIQNLNSLPSIQDFYNKYADVLRYVFEQAGMKIPKNVFEIFEITWDIYDSLTIEVSSKFCTWFFWTTEVNVVQKYRTRVGWGKNWTKMTFLQKNLEEIDPDKKFWDHNLKKMWVWKIWGNKYEINVRIIWEKMNEIWRKFEKIHRFTKKKKNWH